jgi:hypothetical protein
MTSIRSLCKPSRAEINATRVAEKLGSDLKKARARAIVARLKQLYPNPVSSLNILRGHEDYCVGGALCRAVEDNGFPVARDGFPVARDLAAAIADVRGVGGGDGCDGDDCNWSFEKDTHPLKRAATSIIELNDDGEFRLAWMRLEKAIATGA